MIRSAEELACRKIEIDLRGEKGNSMYLLGLVGSLGKRMGWLVWWRMLWRYWSGRIIRCGWRGVNFECRRISL